MIICNVTVTLKGLIQHVGVSVTVTIELDFWGLGFHPTPKISKTACLLSEDLHGSGFNLLGNLLRC